MFVLSCFSHYAAMNVQAHELAGSIFFGALTERSCVVAMLFGHEVWSRAVSWNPTEEPATYWIHLVADIEKR